MEAQAFKLLREEERRKELEIELSAAREDAAKKEAELRSELTELKKTRLDSRERNSMLKRTAVPIDLSTSSSSSRLRSRGSMARSQSQKSREGVRQKDAASDQGKEIEELRRQLAAAQGDALVVQLAHTAAIKSMEGAHKRSISELEASHVEELRRVESLEAATAAMSAALDASAALRRLHGHAEEQRTKMPAAQQELSDAWSSDGDAGFLDAHVCSSWPLTPEPVAPRI